MNFSILPLVTLLALTFQTFAQNPVPESVWRENLTVDGKLEDWNDTLRYEFEDQKFKYSIANDDEYLYISIQIADLSQQLKAVYSGFSITVNTDAKQRPGPTVVFPIPDLAALRAQRPPEDYGKERDQRKAGLEMVRAIYVDEFPSIVGGRISLNNNYGIKTVAVIDSNNHLNYEAAISLKQLQIKEGQDFALNIRINEIITSRFTDPGRRGYPYGYYPYYGMDPYGRDTRPRTGTISKQAPGIWQIISLATP